MLRQTLQALWCDAVASVAGDRVVSHAMAQDRPFAADQIIAVGKAALSMCSGALQTLDGSPSAIVVSKSGSVEEGLYGRVGCTVIEAGHPMPDQRSLQAGRLIFETVERLGRGSRLLLLISGGASSLVELPVDGVGLAKIQQLNKQLIAGGLPISRINEKRRELSRLKGGKLMRKFDGAEVRSYLISDVQGDHVDVIGSGLGSTALAQCESSEKVVACNRMARQHVETTASADGYKICSNAECLYGDVDEVAGKLADEIEQGGAGIYIWGGEPTVQLPDIVGTGGRNQSLALSLAIRLRGNSKFQMLVASTDGDDGNSGVAGAFLDGGSVGNVDKAREALRAADAGAYFARRGLTFDSGDTNTNVMDMAIAFVGS